MNEWEAKDATTGGNIDEISKNWTTGEDGLDSGPSSQPEDNAISPQTVRYVMVLQTEIQRALYWTSLNSDKCEA